MKFKTKFDINDFKELSKSILPRYGVIYMLIIFVLVSSIFLGQYFIGLGGAIVMLIICIIAKKRNYKIVLERLEQTSEGKDVFTYSFEFEDDYLKAHSENNNANLTLYYRDIKKYVEKEKYTLLFTVAHTFLIIETKVAKENNLAKFLYDKNTKIKFKK